ncbi:hypothetical protein BBO_08158 [Beauveria brongniartii RCEF 3172]|uniref:Uncharacterized protein n=1 Tax=Beauveria brongniartii RCEF 3172 TaxID=1081107 RepID=A0A166Y6L8_9HYPO|nr:hypothetical protein BBO_08158 [Beauveria brongniartii RCEF 3172]
MSRRSCHRPGFPSPPSSALATYLFFKEGKQVMVHGQLDLKGANPPALTAAADKIGGLAAARKAEAEKAA